MHTILQRNTPEGLVDHLQLNLESGSSISDLLEILEVDMDTDTILLVVNGRMASPSHKLREDDQVNLMPAISGGSILVK